MSPPSNAIKQPDLARSSAIDLLRGVAVLMVMMAHLAFSYPSGALKLTFPPDPLPRILAHGHWGVQLFLVISGYCIHIRWARKGDLNRRVDFFAFWKRRLLRLYPPYAAIVFLAALATYVTNRMGPSVVTPGVIAMDVVVLLLLVQNLNDASSRIGNGPFWSLALEEQLYLLYFPLLELRRRHGWRITLGLPFVVSLLWGAASDFSLIPMSWNLAWTRVGPAYWFAWTLGAFTAESHLGLVSTPAWTRHWGLFVLLFPIGVALQFPLQGMVASCSFFFLVHTVVWAEKNGTLGSWTKPLVRLGEISYGVYLVHDIAFVASKRALVAMGLPNFLVLVLRFGAGLAAGYVVYRMLEKPFLRRAQKIPVPLIEAPRRLTREAPIPS